MSLFEHAKLEQELDEFSRRGYTHCRCGNRFVCQNPIIVRCWNCIEARYGELPTDRIRILESRSDFEDRLINADMYEFVTGRLG